MKLRVFLIILLIIVFLTLLEHPPRVPGFYKGASPLSSDWQGTSKLVEILVKIGYNVQVVTSWKDTYELVKALTPKPKHIMLIIISPEKPYTSEELSYMLSTLELGSGDSSVLIADEGPYSNAILKKLGGKVYIAYNVMAKGFNNTPFPTAVIKTPSGRKYILMLNYAAVLRPRSGVLVMGLTLTGDIVASYYQTRIGVNKEVKVYVLGDGSIFINEALSLNQSKYDYAEFTRSLMKDLAPNPNATLVLLEGSKYPLSALSLKSITPESLLNDPRKLLTLTGVLLHPYTWFPWLANTLQAYEAKLLHVLASDEALMCIAALFLTIIMYLIITKVLGLRGVSMTSDEALPPVHEIDIVVDTELRRQIVSGKAAKLDKRDFIPLYKIVNETLCKTIGVSLEDKDVIDKLSSLTGIDRRSIESYVLRMNKLKMKIERGKLLPIVLSWSKTVSKLLEESDRILSKLGASLMESRGVEYVLRRK